MKFKNNKIQIIFYMIITSDELLQSGLKVSDQLYDNELELAINTAAHYVVKPRLGEKYNDIIENPDDYGVVISGGKINGTYIAGLKKAMYHISYAFLLRQNIFATSFGTVEKKDEYSEASSASTLWKVAHMNYEIGRGYVKEIQEVLGISNPENKSDYFNEYF